MNGHIVTTDFEGGNPRPADRMRRTGVNEFEITPWNESGDREYHFWFNCTVSNPEDKPRPILLRINWKTTKHMDLRDHLYVKSGTNGWNYIVCETKKTRTIFRSEIPPGTTRVALHPAYTQSDLHDFLGQPDNAVLQKRVFGYSREKREIAAYALNENADKNILVVARMHPYETAGSFAIEGIIAAAVKEVRSFARNGCGLYFLPMPNPDGVANGCCKLTRPGGTNLAFAASSNESEARVMMNLINAVKPVLFIDVHSWMRTHANEILCTDTTLAGDFIRDFPDSGEHWEFHSWLAEGVKCDTVELYAHETHGTTAATFEFPWAGRSAEKIRRLGRETAETMLKFLSRGAV